MSKNSTILSINYILETVKLLEAKFNSYNIDNSHQEENIETKQITALITELEFYVRSSSNLMGRPVVARRQLQWAKNQTGYMLFLLKSGVHDQSVHHNKLNEISKLVINVDEMIDNFVIQRLL